MDIKEQPINEQDKKINQMEIQLSKTYKRTKQMEKRKSTAYWYTVLGTTSFMVKELGVENHYNIDQMWSELIRLQEGQCLWLPIWDDRIPNYP